MWELSRFAVVDKRPEGYTLSEATVRMIKEIIDFAQLKNISSYLAVTSVSVERLMKSAGIPMQRIGVEKAVSIGEVQSVLCLIPVNAQFISATESLLEEYYSTEIAA